VHHPKGVLDDGRKVTVELFRRVEEEELEKIRNAFGTRQVQGGNYNKAARWLGKIITNDEAGRIFDVEGARSVGLRALLGITSP